MSHEIATAGKVAVEKMREAMDTIRQSLESMIQQSEDSNRRIQGIIGIISKITEKTNVINDIVFQTKLLSFNALRDRCSLWIEGQIDLKAKDGQNLGPSLKQRISNYSLASENTLNASGFDPYLMGTPSMRGGLL